jgi:hypothetical protein
MKFLKRIEQIYRRATAAARALPDFVILGTHKGGSSSLYNYVAQHPQIAPSFRKEVHFFCSNHARGDDWYRAHFPKRNAMPPGTITGESTPLYLLHPHAPERAKQSIPGAKFLVLLRDPVERTISHYYHQIRKDRETFTLDDALAAESERTDADWQNLLDDPGHTIEPARRFSYKRRSLYAEQLERWFACYDRDRFFIESSEAFFTEPAVVLQKAFAFLGVDPDVTIPDLRPRNVGLKKADSHDGSREVLAEVFAQHNERLFTLLDRRFSWREPKRSA